jgi:hypothetical protein
MSVANWRVSEAAGQVGCAAAVRLLGVTGTLLRALMSTSPIESMISIGRTTCGNVKLIHPGFRGVSLDL